MRTLLRGIDARRMFPSLAFSSAMPAMPPTVATPAPKPNSSAGGRQRGTGQAPAHKRRKPHPGQKAADALGGEATAYTASVMLASQVGAGYAEAGAVSAAQPSQQQLQQQQSPPKES